MTVTLKNRREKVIWAAAFFEGEGCISLSKRNSGRNFFLRVSVTQKKREPLEIFVALWGGTLERRERGIWRWTIYASSAVLPLQEMESFLVSKKRQAQVAIQFQSLRGVGAPRKEVRQSNYERDLQFHEILRGLKV